LSASCCNTSGTPLNELGSEETAYQNPSLDLRKVQTSLTTGLPTLRDIVDALLRPGRDPREDVPPPVFRQDVLSLEEFSRHGL
jgi:uncharacterized protein